MNQEKVKKIILAAFGGVFVLYIYFAYLLGPLATKEQAAKRKIADLKPRVEQAEKEIAKTRGKENANATAVRARQLRETLEATIPTGAPIAWFPQRISEFFDRHQVKQVQVSIEREAPDPNIHGFKLSQWKITVPAIEFNRIGSIIADLENQEGLAQLSSITIHNTPGGDEKQHVSFQLSTLVK